MEINRLAVAFLRGGDQFFRAARVQVETLLQQQSQGAMLGAAEIAVDLSDMHQQRGGSEAKLLLAERRVVGRLQPGAP